MMKRLLTPFICPAFIAILSCTSASAEPQGSVGRYQDGRAYRVDSQGLQLSDQIAELEVTIREQEQQIISCEEKLSLVSGGKKLPSAESKITASPTVTAASCSPFVQPIQARVNQLLEQTATLEGENRRLQQQVSLSRENAIARGQLSQLEEDLRTNQHKLSAQESEFRREVSQLRENLTSRERELSEKQKREAELLANIDQLSKQLVTARSTQASRPTPPQPARAMLSSPRNDTPSEDLTAARSKIRNDLAVIQKLIVKRKDLSDALRTSKKGVIAALQPLETSRKIPLDQLRAKAQSMTSSSEANQISSGLSEIRSSIQSDIEVFERLLKHL